MITKDNLPEVLRSFEFEENKNVWTKKYSTGASVTVDFNSAKINYAPLDENFSMGEYPTKEKPSSGFVIHRDTTINFNSKENFVCLVCIHLLLKKGYEAKHIVIEPAFKVAHGIKPSFGDILVFDKEYDPLVLIENKTYGAEFSKEWNLMQKDGGQLFGYLGEIVKTMKLCQNLVLFAADFEENRIVPKSHIITLKDNEKRIAELDNPKTFANAQGNYFEVWNQTYRNAIETKGLVEDDIAAYSVGKLKYTINDLNGLSHAEIRPIYHEFATILRNHAITDFEHSFYILIDLFLCKITDERNNPDDLQFYYKGVARDTPKEYCNRLLKLYQLGKQQLFNVEVINKDEEDIIQIFRDTSRNLTNGLFAGIKALFEEMKFYNIKKFNFIDVENKEEFEMNFQILIKITALIQDINLSSSETNHFFGDLFEGLLSKNVHQTEGQFFTPLPIVNFIINSLPQFPNKDKVKVLDYACGAGHFLTEFIKHYPKVKVYGIEKSQTLSQVAKIATIINGSLDSRIVFKDSLSLMNTMDVRYQGFDRESFDCIIANPPYSVKGFLDTLEQKDRDQFVLSKSVDEKAYSTNRSIECFFVERAQHFLKKDGLMGIVLPSSLLSNENIYTKTREIIFANFNILAIAVMNSRTFGSTGTNTIILFAQKVAKKNSEGLLHAFIDKKEYTAYTTCGSIESYIKKQGYPKDEYFAFMQDNILGESLENTEIFKDYQSNFKPSRVAKSLQKEWFANSEYYRKGLKENSKEYKNLFALFLSSNDYRLLEETEYRRQFIAFAKDIECGKLNVYIQTDNNVVAILQSPPEKIENKSNKAEVVKFLGYDWSNRKGDEGIKYLTSHVQEAEGSDDDDDKDAEIVQAINSIKYIETPLYNPDDDNDVTKFSYALRKHITDKCNRFSFGTISKNCEKSFVGGTDKLLQFVKLTNLIDFGKTAFTFSIKTNIDKNVQEIKYKKGISVNLLGNICDIQKGTAITSSEIEEGEYKVVAGGIDYAYMHNNYNRPENVITVSASGANAGYVNFWQEKIFASDCTTIIGNSFEETCFIYYFLKANQNLLFSLQKGAAQPHVYANDLKQIKIPILPTSVQNKIVAECQKIDTEALEAKKQIIELQEEITDIVSRVNGDSIKLGDIYKISSGGTPSRKKSAYWINGNIPWVTTTEVTNEIITSTNECITKLGLENSSAKIYPINSLIIAMYGQGATRGRTAKLGIEACTNQACAVLYEKKIEVETDFVWYYMQSQYEKLRSISHGSVRPNLNANDIANYEIPLPSLSEQKDIVEKIGAIESKIATLKMICDGASARKEAVLHRELIEDDKDDIGITTEKAISILTPTDVYQPVDYEPMMAAEPFGCYKWEGFDQSIRDFFGNDQTILVGCYKGKAYRDWIDARHLYNIRMGKTKGSMEANRELFGSTSLLVLYEIGKPDKLSAYKIVDHREIGKDELTGMGYPNKKPRKSYMAFSLEPLDMNLTFLVEHHLIERIIELDADHAKGTPIFIEP